MFDTSFERSHAPNTKERSTTETLEPCPNPECQSAKATTSNDFANYYVYCPDCFLRGPRESVDHYGARWNALPRISPGSAAPVVDEEQVPSQEPTLADLAYEAANFLDESVHMVTDSDKRKAQQIAFALRATVSAGNKPDFAYADGYYDGFRQGKQSLAAATAAAVEQSDELARWSDVDNWPLPDVLNKLADATEHLLRDHNCDEHGHETFKYAALAARRHVALLTAAPSSTSARAAAEEIAKYLDETTPLSIGGVGVRTFENIIKRHCQ